ncbi:hypothetical protein Pelo_3310 [Pelomyxa schiedti]|nr:hypothetical protein Pelo_3310 [Pelomyxa schiedti]
MGSAASAQQRNKHCATSAQQPRGAVLITSHNPVASTSYNTAVVTNNRVVVLGHPQSQPHAASVVVTFGNQQHTFNSPSQVVQASTQPVASTYPITNTPNAAMPIAHPPFPSPQQQQQQQQQTTSYYSTPPPPLVHQYQYPSTTTQPNANTSQWNQQVTGTSPAAVGPTEYLPQYWQVSYSNGKKFYIDHTRKVTMWRCPWMPPNWELWLDNATKRVFYINTLNKTTQWNPPSPSGWVVMFDQHTGIPFYLDSNGVRHSSHPYNEVDSTSSTKYSQPQTNLPTSNTKVAASDALTPPDYEKMVLPTHIWHPTHSGIDL